MPRMMSRACCGGAGPVDLRAARFELPDELFEIAVEVVDRLPLRLRRRSAARPASPGRPPLRWSRATSYLPIAVWMMPAMAQVGGEAAGVLLELGGGRAH